jgi:hypothetical protein
MDFSNAEYGVLVGDPINHKLFIVQTQDQGENWKVNSFPKTTTAFDQIEGEAFFASSGTNIKMMSYGYNHFVFATGGKASRFSNQRELVPIPIMQGKESTGANSIALFKDKTGIIVGGDFTKDTISNNNCALFSLSKDDAVSFHIPITPPHGYRSCVIYLTKKNLLTCGTSGIDISKDGGNNWELISKESFHVCQKAKKGKAVFLAGSNGRIAKLIL